MTMREMYPNLVAAILKNDLKDTVEQLNKLPGLRFIFDEFKDYKTLTNALPKSTLKILYLQYPFIPDEHKNTKEQFRALLDSIARSQVIELHFDIKVEFIDDLIEFLPRLTKLESLTFNCPIAPDKAASIANLLPQLNLKTVGYCNAYFSSDASLEILLKSLYKFTIPPILDLSRNEYLNDNLLNIINNLIINNMLKGLYLNDNKLLSVKKKIELIQSLRNNKQLEQLVLFLTPVDSALMEELAAVLPTTKLKYLSLGNSGIKDEDFKKTVKILPGTQISKLDIRFNTFLKSSILDLFKILPQTNIEALNISSIPLSLPRLRELKLSLENNNKLTYLEFDIKDPNNEESKALKNKILKILETKKQKKPLKKHSLPSTTQSDNTDDEKSPAKRFKARKGK